MGTGRSGIVAFGHLKDVADALERLAYLGQSDKLSAVDTISIEIVDAGGLSASRTVKVEVESHSPPTITRVGRLASLPENPHMDEDSELLLDAVEVSIPSSSPHSTVQVEIFASNGVVKLPVAENSADFSAKRRDTGAGVVVAGKIDRVNRALRSLIYKPKADLWGADELSFVAREGRGDAGGAWNPIAGIESIIVFIGPINDPPRIDLPAHLSGDVLPAVSGGEILSLEGIVVYDPDIEEPASSGLIHVDVDAGSTGGLLCFAFSRSIVQGRIRGVRFDEGSADGNYRRLAFNARIDIANDALGLLRFFVPFGQPSGFNNVTITVSDLGNWGYGDVEEDSTVVSIDIRYRQDPFAVIRDPIEWSTSPGALTMEEDGRLDDLGLALVPDGVSASAATWVEAIVEAEHGVVEIRESGRQVHKRQSRIDIVRRGPGSMSVSGALGDVSAAISDWLYLPEPDYHGIEMLQLSVHGRMEEWMANATIPVLVRSRPDLPIVTVTNSTSTDASDRRTVEVGSRLTLHGISIEHVDAMNGDPSRTLTMMAYSAAGNGTVVMNDMQAGLWVYTDDKGAGSLVARGAVENLQLALDYGALEYSPLAGYDGVDDVTISVSVDPPYRYFSHVNASRTQELADPEKVEATFEVIVVPAFVPAKIVFEVESLFHTDEGSAVELTGIRIGAPGRRNMWKQVVTVSLGTDAGGITLPTAERRRDLADGQGQSSMSITGTEFEVNAALSGAVFTPSLFYNGVAAIKVSFLAGSSIIIWRSNAGQKTCAKFDFRRRKKKILRDQLPTTNSTCITNARKRISGARTACKDNAQ